MFLRVMIFLLASTAAGGAAWLMNLAGTEGAGTRVEVRTEQVAIPTDVLVAAADISGGDVLSADKLRWEPWPAGNVNDHFITRETRPDAV